jgi:hypothetical protein
MEGTSVGWRASSFARHQMHLLIAPQRWRRRQPNAGGSTRDQRNAAFRLAHSGFLNLSWNIDERSVTINSVLSHY